MSAAPPPPPALLVSDFAGTAMHESGTVLAAYRSSLSAAEIPFTEADLAARRGASKRGVVEEVPGAAGAFRALRAAGVKLALTSGFDRPTVALLLRRLGWEDLFDV